MIDQVMVGVFQRGRHEIMENRPCPAAGGAWRSFMRAASRTRAIPIGSAPYNCGRLMQPTFTTRPDIRGTFGAVATTHWLATQTGMAVLERSGNACDAAVTAGFVLQIA